MAGTPTRQVGRMNAGRAITGAAVVRMDAAHRASSSPSGPLTAAPRGYRMYTPRPWAAYRVCERCRGWLYVYEVSVRHGCEWACLTCGARRYEGYEAYRRRYA